MYRTWITAVSGLLLWAASATGAAPPCVTITNDTARCLGGGAYSWTFAVTNFAGFDVAHLGFVELPAGASATPSLVTLPVPLPAGQGTSVTVTVTGVAPGSLCLRVTAHTADLAECCAVDHCVPLPDCCLEVTGESLVCTTNGALYTFTVQNLGAGPVSYVSLTPLDDCFSFDPPILYLTNALAPGQSITLSAVLQAGPGCDSNLCFRVGIHDASFNECCSVVRCVTSPECCLELSAQSLRWTTNGLTYGFTVKNLSGIPAGYVSLVPLDDCFSFDPPIMFLTNALAQGQSATVSAVLQAGAACGSNLYFLVAIHDAGFNACCSIIECVSVDRVPPVIHCPSNLVVNCTNGGGVVVEFAVTATDNSGLAPEVRCTPPSGSTFPLGTNRVTCVAFDGFCNSNACEFTVTVIDAVRPRLDIRLAGASVVICWPVTCADYVLEQTAGLNPPISWTPVGAGVSVVSDRYEVTLPLTPGHRFFRLRRL